jgi:hypothetical protein
MKLSIVIPCLNEEDTIGTCVETAVRAIETLSIEGEVLVADNGSSDRSVEIALEKGAHVVRVAERGYGHALKAGISASHGQFIIMGDADCSYDFNEAPKFVERLQQGFDLVQGCRFSRGGGQILPGAMPWMHRYVGNPILSWLIRRMFRIPVHDVYCGLRAFRRDLYQDLELRSSGMEFATEMIIRAGLLNAKMTQVPITLHPDKRQSHGSHLRTFRDGWRTLRLFLIYSPKWAFFGPGGLMMALGSLGYCLALPQVVIVNAALDVHTLLVSSLFLLLGWQAILFAALARIFAGQQGMLPEAKQIERWCATWGPLLGVLGLGVGIILVMVVFIWWWQSGFGRLDYPFTMRWVVPGVTLCALSFQTMMASLFASALPMARNR